MSVGKQLRLPCRAKIKWNCWMVVILDRPMSLLKALYIVSESLQKLLGVLGGKYNPAFYLSLWPAWHYTNEIHYKLRNRVINDCKVGIGAFCGFFVQFYIDLFLGLIFFLRHLDGNKNP